MVNNYNTFNKSIGRISIWGGGSYAQFLKNGKSGVNWNPNMKKFIKASVDISTVRNAGVYMSLFMFGFFNNKS